eukprot:SAG22_NODE_887_length_6660_cov_2.023929_4_plen_266_part_00
MRDECVMLTEDQVEEIITIGRMTSCEMSDCGIICDANDGTYVVQWTAIKAKQYTVEVAREASREPGGGIAVPNSPFTSEVVAGDTSVFGCISSGQGRFSGVAGVDAVIDIKTADLYGNKKTYGGDRFPWLLARLANGVQRYANEPGFVETDYAKVHDAIDNEDGTYQFTYWATVAATYTLDVRLIAELYPEPGEFIVDSPWFNVRIHPAPARCGAHFRAFVPLLVGLPPAAPPMCCGADFGARLPLRARGFLSPAAPIRPCARRS